MGSKGDSFFLLSLILNAFSWMTNANVDLGIKVVTGLFGILLSIMAIRYYMIATREKKMTIEKMLQDKKVAEEGKK